MYQGYSWLWYPSRGRERCSEGEMILFPNGFWNGFYLKLYSDHRIKCRESYDGRHVIVIYLLDSGGCTFIENTCIHGQRRNVTTKLNFIPAYRNMIMHSPRGRGMIKHPNSWEIVSSLSAGIHEEPVMHEWVESNFAVRFHGLAFILGKRFSRVLN